MDQVHFKTSSAREFRGAWVATVFGIDWPLSTTLSSDQQRDHLVQLLDKLHQLHFNVVIFQIRSAADALYCSKYDPWSATLTGSQGTAPHPNWDPLATAVAQAHNRGMELHAWFNPYRARTGSTVLAPNHIANQLPQYAYSYGRYLWMDPGAKEVQTRTLDTILDVVNHYDVDGIHLDDYFYPYPVAGQDFPDNATYDAYVAGGGRLSRDEWRHHSVDTFIQTLSQRIKSARPWVKFGVSPFGIWMSGHPPGVEGFSSKKELYADSRKWLSEGWVDYLSPQLYWKIGEPRRSFTDLADWWLQQNTFLRHLYLGCAADRTADSTWPVTEIQAQVDATRARKNMAALGNIFFSAKYFRDNTQGISDLFSTSVYPKPALAPTMDWMQSDMFDIPTPIVDVAKGSIAWCADKTGKIRAYAVYRQDGDDPSTYILHRVVGRETLSVTAQAGSYALTAVDRLARESKPCFVTV